MLIARQQIVLLLTTTVSYFIGQVLTGTDATVAALFATAILFGMLSVVVAGGLASAFGSLNALLIGKFLLFGVALKIILLEPADNTLNSPMATGLVMALGFFGLLLGTGISVYLPRPKWCSFNRPYSDRTLLSFSIVLVFVSYLAYFASLIPDTQGQGLQTGGWLGVARMLASLKSLSIVPAMLYLWRTKSRLWMTHPIILVMLTWSIVIGIFSTAKQQAIEPLAFYCLVGVLRYGWRDLRLWSLVATGAAYYAIIVFPYSQYVRSNGGREGTFGERAQVTNDIFWRIASNEDFRSKITEGESKEASYFNEAALVPFSRLAMVGEADRLISATLHQQAFTGWTTIIWGFKLVTPSFLSPDKPIFEAGNFLAHIVGDVGPSDRSTQMSYGVMANLYNAFSFPGVLIGSALFFTGFFYWIRIFVGDPRWEGAPTVSTFWFVWLIGLYQHSIVESSLSGSISSLTYFPFVILLVGGGTKVFCVFLPQRTRQA